MIYIGLKGRMIKMDWDELEWKPSCCIFKLPFHYPLPMTKKKHTEYLKPDQLPGRELKTSPTKHEAELLPAEQRPYIHPA